MNPFTIGVGATTIIVIGIFSLWLVARRFFRPHLMAYGTIIRREWSQPTAPSAGTLIMPIPISDIALPGLLLPLPTEVPEPYFFIRLDDGNGNWMRTNPEAFSYYPEGTRVQVEYYHERGGAIRVVNAWKQN